MRWPLLAPADHRRSQRWRSALRRGGLLLATIGACARQPLPAPAPAPEEEAYTEAASSGRRLGAAPLIRVVLAQSVTSGAITADAPWSLVAGDGRVLLTARPGDRYALSGTQLSGPAGNTTLTGTVSARTDDGSPLRFGGKRYRGEVLLVVQGGAGVAAVNRLSLEEYLRGVVPLEIGTRDPRDRPAIEAQAVAARSFAAARIGSGARPWDVTATVADQVYGGADAERPESDAAVRSTRGLVLTWDNRIISAPYSAHGGPMTAAPEEIWWRRGGEPFLRAVDDRMPDGRCYCDASGQREWERRFTGGELAGLIDRFGAAAGARPPRGAGRVSGVRIAERGPSGRVTALELDTDGGRVTLRGNDIRMVLRSNGAILPSTRFSVEVSQGIGEIAVMTVRGVGNGHGVGMSQWGAIGRARAGQDARSILAAYYPGTRLAPLE